MKGPVSFWGRVSIGMSDQCWPWTGARFHFGHGAVSVPDRKYPDRAHRIAWRLTYGEIPTGKCVLHHCDNPSCCNPKHLFIGTKTDNARDRDKKGRTAHGLKSGRYTKPERTARGSRNGRAKISIADVIMIRAAREHGRTLADIAKKYGIGTSQVRRITTGQSWLELK